MEVAPPYSLSRRVPSATRPPLPGAGSGPARRASVDVVRRSGLRHERPGTVQVVRACPARGLLALAAAAMLAATAGCGGSSPSSSKPSPDGSSGPAKPSAAAKPASLKPNVGTMPPLVDPNDVYAAGRPGKLATAARAARPLLYVP